MRYFPKKKFELKKAYNPYWSTFICFCCTVANESDISKETMRRNFNELVDPEDYSKSEKNKIFDWLWCQYENKNLSK